MKKIYFTWFALGDQLALIRACEIYYEKHGEKLNIILKNTEFAQNNNQINLFDDIDKNRLFDINYLKEFELINKVKIIFITIGTYQKRNEELIAIWPKTHLITSFASKLGVEGKFDITPRFYLSEEEKKFGKFFEKDQIVIISSGIKKYKNLGVKQTQKIVDKLKDKYNFVQVGPLTDPLLKGVLDKRQELSFRQIASVLYNSSLFVGPIGALMHLARSVDCCSVIAYSAEPLKLASYDCNINVLSESKCDLCATDKLDPYHEFCPLKYECIKKISVDKIIKAIDEQIKNPKQCLPQYEYIKSNPLNDLKELKLSLEVNFLSESNVNFKKIKTPIYKKIFRIEKVIKGNIKRKYIILFGIKIRFKKRNLNG